MSIKFRIEFFARAAFFSVASRARRGFCFGTQRAISLFLGAYVKNEGFSVVASIIRLGGRLRYNPIFKNTYGRMDLFVDVRS